MYKLGKKSKANMARLHPRLQLIINRAIEITEQDFSVHSGARTAKEQNELYQQGRTKPGKKVTSKDGYKNKSNHQVSGDGYGRAVDLVPWDGEKLVWDWDLIYPIAVAMRLAADEYDAELRWGGNWYERMSQYPATIEGVKEAVERYKREHPGPDHIDGPHFELLGV